jgi:hypothetical protein
MVRLNGRPAVIRMNGLASPARGAELAGAHTMEVARGRRAQFVYAPPAVVQLAGARRPSSSRVHAVWPNSSPPGAGDEIARASSSLTDVELAAAVLMGSPC